MKKEPTYLLYVYGTLKRGWHNHARLLGEATFCGQAISEDKFAMYAPSFPRIFDRKDGHRVLGELYRVTPTTLERCDRLESHPNYYRRELRQFIRGDGHTVTAWVYLYQHPEAFAQRDAQKFRVHPNKEGVLEWTQLELQLKEKDHA
jgi:gamma-glutamylaminecyclotransferase